MCFLGWRTHGPQPDTAPPRPAPRQSRKALCTESVGTRAAEEPTPGQVVLVTWLIYGLLSPLRFPSDPWKPCQDFKVKLPAPECGTVSHKLWGGRRPQGAGGGAGEHMSAPSLWDRGRRGTEVTGPRRTVRPRALSCRGLSVG